MELIFFRVNGQAYGMKIDSLEGVEDLNNITPVANAPSNVVGITNIRGEVVPIFDLAGKFEKTSASSQNKYLFVRINDEPLCLKVDSVDGMNTFSDKEVLKVPGILKSEGTGYISNVVRMTNNELALVISPDKLVSSGERKSIVDFMSGI